MRSFKTACVARPLASVTIAALLTGTAGAQDAVQAGATSALEEIIVTARKRSERLLDVPVAVTAVESDSLVEQNLVRLQDYATRIPGLRVTGDRSNTISLRGINAGGGTSPTVAVTIDDVPFGSSSWAGNGVFPDLDPSDLQRVEVLRGPQGSLYGAASLGGLIKLVTTDPDPTGLSGRVETTGTRVSGDGDGYAVRGAINVPVVKDKLAVRASGFRREEAPYFGSIHPRLAGKNVDNAEYEGYRGAVRFQPLDSLAIDVSYLEQTTDVSDRGAVQLTPFPTNYKPLFGYYVRNQAPSAAETKIELTQARISLDLPFATLTSLSGWGKISHFIDSDVTNGFPFVFTLIYPGSPAGSQVRLVDGAETEKFSQELRLTSNGNGAFAWQIGAFYTDEDSELSQDLTANDINDNLIGPIIVFPLPSTFEEKAVFGDVTYHFTDKFDVQVGARYSENDQTYQPNQVVAAPAQPLFGPSRDGTISRSSDNATTWLVTPTYRLNDDLMFYGRIATGYRPGGPNTATAPETTFDPDTVTNYEVGVKGYAFNRSLVVDASIFDIEWKDIQLQAQGTTGVAYLTNSGKARSRGIEAAVQYAPGGGWLFNANMTLMDAEVLEDLPLNTAGGPSLIGRKGDPLPYSAKFSGNLGIEKTWDLFGSWSLALGGNLSYVGERDTLFRSTAAPAARQGKLKAPSYQVIDLRATLTNDRWNAALFARNLGSERGLVQVADGQGVQAATSGSFIAPESIGLSLSWTF